MQPYAFAVAVVVGDDRDASFEDALLRDVLVRTYAPFVPAYPLSGHHLPDAYPAFRVAPDAVVDADAVVWCRNSSSFVQAESSAVTFLRGRLSRASTASESY